MTPCAHHAAYSVIPEVWSQTTLHCRKAAAVQDADALLSELEGWQSSLSYPVQVFDSDCSLPSVQIHHLGSSSFGASTALFCLIQEMQRRSPRRMRGRSGHLTRSRRQRASSWSWGMKTSIQTPGRPSRHHPHGNRYSTLCKAKHTIRKRQNHAQGCTHVRASQSSKGWIGLQGGSRIAEQEHVCVA